MFNSLFRKFMVFGVDDAIILGVGAAEQGANALLQQGNNKQARRYNTYMYDRQRADALADWHMQAAYNSPAAQMQRLKEAGLNPKLIYGSGASGAAQYSGPVRSSSAGSWKPDAPQINPAQSLAQMYSTRLLQSNIDKNASISSLNEEKKRQAAATSAGIMARTLNYAKEGKLIDARTANTAFHTQLGKALAPYQIDIASKTVDLTQARRDQAATDAWFKIQENARRIALTNANIQEKMQHIALMYAQERATQEGTGLTSDKRQQIAQAIANAAKTGELIEINTLLKKSEYDYQTAERIQDWLKVITGGMKKR